jgi:hypothetical protein
MKRLIKVLAVIALLFGGWLFLVRFLRKPVYRDKGLREMGPMFMSQQERKT